MEIKGKGIPVLMIAALLVSLMTACSGRNGASDSTIGTVNSESETAAAEKEVPLELLEYTYYEDNGNLAKFSDNPNDVLTPIIEQKFNVKVSQVLYNQGAAFRERFNMLIATNDLPDVIRTQSSGALISSSGQYVEVGPLMKQYMPNLLQYAPEETWRDALFEGKMYAIPSVWIDTSTDQFKDDLYSLPNGNWGLVVREDILERLGYQFTPLREIEKHINETQRKPTLDDFKVEPEIKTPEDLYQLLKKIKELNLKVGDREMIPLTIPQWGQHHLANMFGAGSTWQYHSNDQSVTGALFGDKHAKEYYRYLNKLYQEGLLDPDFSIQKNEQLTEKTVSGLAAAAMWLPDAPGANAQMEQVTPGKMFHPIPMPVKEGIQRNGIDPFSPVTFQMYVKKDFKDIPRLLQYFDWFYSDEALELKIWGPEELELWEIKDGKKVFKDQNLYHALLENKDGSIADEQYYNRGLGNISQPKQFSKAYGAAPGPLAYNPFDWQRSYPYKVADIFNLAQAYVTTGALEREGELIGGIDELTNTPTNWLWSDFYAAKSAELYTAKSESEFDAKWNELEQEFLNKTNYKEALAIMTEVFRARGKEVR